MHVTNIELHGFKSFAKKTSLDFLPPKDEKNSVTVIVGPNGSGKSNISDAIRWVMGEQSMRQLRGKKASDIIFSGSESKGAMSVASVFITLDNHDGRMPIDYEEVVIGRRIYKTGESEYLINNTVVRLIDLQILLAKAQFGQGSYSVIGQGMIDKLLLQSNQERKDFFDEASGIKEFQIKRHQAHLRLKRTTENIEQAELLLAEVSPRLKSLSRQVKKLEQRQEVELTLRETQEQYYVTLWKHHDTQIQKIQTVVAGLDTELQEGQKKLQTIQEELASLAQQQSRQELFKELQKKHQAIVQESNVLERERVILQGKLQTEYTKSGNYQMGWLETKVVELQERKKTFDLEISNEQTIQEEKQKDVDTLSERMDELVLSRTTLRSEIGALESTLLRLKTEESAFHISGFRAVQAVLEARHRLGNVRGVVAQLGSVENDVLLALDVAAGGRLASIVVDTEQDARSCVQYLREGKFGVATFLPLSKIRPRGLPEYINDYLGREGVLGLAQDLVEHDRQYAEVFSFIFGSTIVVEDFDTARRLGIGRVRMVTLQGDLFETSGEIKGGHRNKKQQGLSFADGDANKSEQAVSRCEETILEKHNTFQALEKDIEEIQKALQEKHANLRLEMHKQQIKETQKTALEEELARLEQETALQTMSPEQFGETMETIRKQKDTIDNQIEGIQVERTKAARAIECFNEEEEEKKQRVFALQDAMQVQQGIVGGGIEKKNIQAVELAKLETKQEDLGHELYQEMRLSIETILERGIEEKPIEELEGLQVTVQKLKYKLSLIGGIDEEVVQEFEETKARHDGLSSQLNDLQKAMKDLDTLIEELDAVMKKTRNKAFKEIKKEFSRYFEMVFSGGKADLVEVYGEEDVDEEEQAGDTEMGEQHVDLEEGKEQAQKKKTKKVLKGIDIVACPPGKKIKHIQALSGGERTLTSIALMCAILKTNPSPFVVFDEVEAALDEANTRKVAGIIQELSRASQFIIISHNRVTMHIADALYGVTMGNDGMSHLFSVKMEEVTEELVS